MSNNSHSSVPIWITVPQNKPSQSYTVNLPAPSVGNTIIFTPNINGWIIGMDNSEEITLGSIEKEIGCNCVKCKSFNEYAEPNQENGTFICYPCRKGW